MRNKVLLNICLLKKDLFFCLTVFGSFCFSNFFSQTPPLGACANFAIYTAVGAINSNGTTNVTGDIGTDVGAFNGFPPGIIIGQSHVADATSAQAAIDVDLAYTYLTGLACDSVISVILGGNQTLTPQTYCIGAAATLNGDLILDAQGNPNAIFILKINGALSTGTLSHVLLINSALFNHVYWQINGLLTLGNQSVFKGIALINGAMSLLDSATVDGQVLSKAGAITLSNNHVSISSNVALPIELYLFSVRCENQTAILNWRTASENNNQFFFIERSTDAMHWTEIGRLLGAGNSIIACNYSFTDGQTLDALMYYRLKQYDFDGQFKYSSSVYLSDCKQRLDGIGIFPNPGSGKFNLSYEGDQNGVTGILIYNVYGQLIYQSDVFQEAFNLSNNAEGTYFLYIKNANSIVSKKVVIEKF